MRPVSQFFGTNKSSKYFHIEPIEPGYREPQGTEDVTLQSQTGLLVVILHLFKYCK